VRAKARPKAEEPREAEEERAKMLQADRGGGGTAYYVYAASGQRVRKVWEKNKGNLIEERLYLGGFEIYREHEGAVAPAISADTATLERETVHVMDDKQRIALVETRTLDKARNDRAPRQLLRYQFGNHLGSCSLELDETAQIISYEEYAPYGSSTYQAVRSQTETAKRYRYTGKERDEESGLYYHGARCYAPWLGRWTAVDPIFHSKECISSYVGLANNPVIFVDPYGKQETGLTRAIDRDLDALESGRMSQQEFNQRADARAVGTILGLAILVTGELVGQVLASTAVRALAIGIHLSVAPITSPSVAVSSAVSGGVIASGGAAISLSTAETTVAAATSTAGAAAIPSAGVGALAKATALGTAATVALKPDPLGLNQAPSTSQPGERVLLQSLVRSLREQGIDDPDARREIIDAGLRRDPASSTKALAFFKGTILDLYVQRLAEPGKDLSYFGLRRGRSGGLETMVETINRIVEGEAAGFEVRLEVPVRGGPILGKERWLDIGYYKDDVLVRGFQLVKNVGSSASPELAPREVGLAQQMSARLGGVVEEVVTGIQRPIP